MADPTRRAVRAALAQKRRDPAHGADGWTFVGAPLPDPRQYPALRKVHAVWSSAHHLVLVSTARTAWGEVEHLWVKRHDGKPIHDWRALQRIKEAIVGDRTALEVYPLNRDVVDDANFYHLWVLPEDMTLPFGLHPGAAS